MPDKPKNPIMNLEQEEAYDFYYNMKKRSLKKMAQETDYALGTLQDWCMKFGWVSRAKQQDLELQEYKKQMAIVKITDRSMNAYDKAYEVVESVDTEQIEITSAGDFLRAIEALGKSATQLKDILGIEGASKKVEVGITQDFRSQVVDILTQLEEQANGTVETNNWDSEDDDEDYDDHEDDYLDDEDDEDE